MKLEITLTELADLNFSLHRLLSNNAYPPQLTVEERERIGSLLTKMGEIRISLVRK
jgi:hypothetical protein